MRVLLGFLLAPLVPAGVVLLAPVLPTPVLLAIFKNGLLLLPLIGYPITLILGVPVYWLFRKNAWLKAWQVTLAAAALGVVVPVIIPLIVLAAGLLDGRSFSLSLLAEAANAWAGFILLGGVVGVVCGFVFWLIAVYGSHQTQPNHSHAKQAP
jgi:hypothetical protein